MTSERAILEYLNKVRKQKIPKFRGMRVGFFGLPDFQYYKYQTLVNSSSVLQKKGYVKKGKMGEYYITDKGINFLNTRENILNNFETDLDNANPKNLLIVYDIPENQKKERNWFRFHLKKFHFIMIQRSVWVGPGPLPPEFVNFVKEIKLGDNFKTFKLSKGYEIN